MNASPLTQVLWAFTWPVLIGATIGVPMLVWSWRGRRIDDHPHCRKCGYDLFGSPGDAKACPECGADLKLRKAVRMGARRKRPIFFIFGLLVFLMTAALGSLHATQTAEKLGWQRVKPVWWLVREAKQPPGAVSDRALSELVRRMEEDELWDSQVSRLTDLALVMQADNIRLWKSQWADMIEIAFQQERLPEHKMRQYVAQALEGAIVFHVPIRVRRGEDMPCEVTIHPLRTAGYRRRRIIGLFECRIRLGDSEQPFLLRDDGLRPLRTAGVSGKGHLEKHHLALLPDGPLDPLGHRNYRAKAIITVEYATSPDENDPKLKSLTLEFESPFELVPADSPRSVPVP